MRIACFTFLCLLLVLPASAGILYDNGPVNGEINAWTINFTYQVADTFTLAAPSTVTGADLYVWLYPGDNFTNVDWWIGTDPTNQGGTEIASGTAAVTSTFQYVNSWGYDINYSVLDLPNVSLGAGTYWLMFQNGVSAGGNPVYWDENDGPSLAWESSFGAIGSETFRVLGTTGPSVPEPASLVLFGSGLLLLGGLLRRRLS